MGLLRLTGIQGEAEVLGKVRVVEFEGGQLVLGAGELTVDEALAILARLETGALVTVQTGALVTPGRSTPDDGRGDAWEAPPVSHVAPAAPVPVAPPPAPLAAPPVPPVQAVGYVVPAAPLVPVPPAVVAAPLVVVPPPPQAVPAPAEDLLPPAAPMEAPAVEVPPPDVCRAQTLRPVVGWLLARGVTGLEPMLVAVAALAPHVPTVAKIAPAELRTRVATTLGRMDLLTVAPTP